LERGNHQKFYPSKFSAMYVYGSTAVTEAAEAKA